ncbi:Histidine protein methyltransferase 1 [Fusarium oxysporum f. sp. albedinis]|nr:Histidine protein methyltransferase 1 [Fusarium oxysporum f. sp. albedinis]
MINLLDRNNKILSQNRRYKGELVDSTLMIILSWLEPSTLELLFVTFAPIIEPTFEPQPRNRLSDLQGHDQIEGNISARSPSSSSGTNNQESFEILHILIMIDMAQPETVTLFMNLARAYYQNRPRKSIV